MKEPITIHMIDELPTNYYSKTLARNSILSAGQKFKMDGSRDGFLRSWIVEDLK